MRTNIYIVHQNRILLSRRTGSEFFVRVSFRSIEDPIHRSVSVSESPEDKKREARLQQVRTDQRERLAAESAEEREAIQYHHTYLGRDAMSLGGVKKRSASEIEKLHMVKMESCVYDHYASKFGERK